MNTTLWAILGYVFVAGFIGGAVNALMSDNGFIWPRKEDQGGTGIWRPGFLGNMFIGGIAGCISWGLYGPFAAAHIIPDKPTPDLNLTVSALVGAVLIGIGGARWLTNEVDKSLLRAAAIKAATGQPDPSKATRMSVAPPAEALKIASE